jgi:hypothetical protein
MSLRYIQYIHFYTMQTNATILHHLTLIDMYEHICKIFCEILSGTEIKLHFFVKFNI